MALIIAVIFTIYMISKVNEFYGLLFIGLIGVFFLLCKAINRALWKLRRDRYELRNTRVRLLVKIIMSKIEILQSNNIDNEMNRIYDNAYSLRKVNRDMSLHRTLLKRTSPL